MRAREFVQPSCVKLRVIVPSASLRKLRIDLNKFITIFLAILEHVGLVTKHIDQVWQVYIIWGFFVKLLGFNL